MCFYIVLISQNICTLLLILLSTHLTEETFNICWRPTHISCIHLLWSLFHGNANSEKYCKFLTNYNIARNGVSLEARSGLEAWITSAHYAVSEFPIPQFSHFIFNYNFKTQYLYLFKLQAFLLPKACHNTFTESR